MLETTSNVTGITTNPHNINTTCGGFTFRDGQRQLNVGVMWDDLVVKPVAPVARALEEVVDKLRSLEGFTVSQWIPYQHDRAMKILVLLYSY